MGETGVLRGMPELPVVDEAGESARCLLDKRPERDCAEYDWKVQRDEAAPGREWWAELVVFHQERRAAPGSTRTPDRRHPAR